MQWLIEVLEGHPTSEAAQHLQAGFIAWARSGGHAPDGVGRGRPTFPSLATCLGLPSNPDKAMLRVRDTYLRQASELVGVDYAQRWQRAVGLHAATQRFMVRSWPCWWALKAPPEHATRLEALLWHAARAGSGKLPQTARRYHQIIGD